MIGPKRKYRVAPMNWSAYREWKIQVSYRRFLFWYSPWRDQHEADGMTRQEAEDALKLFEARP